MSEPIENSLERVQEWLSMGRWGRRFQHQLWYYAERHYSLDAPLMNGNMRSE